MSTLNVHGPTEILTLREPQEKYENFIIWLEPNQRLTISDTVSDGFLEIKYETISKMCSSANVHL
jgi:hypothetical protein